MGFMGLLFKVAVECFNILAWPLFALVYPLCASVQAIEPNTTSGTLKLITYWVCFSLILLFEHAFEKLLEWLPYWPYIKLMIIGCLVTPHFDGSLYVYKHIVHPCLSMNPRVVFDWLIKLLELLKQDNLLVEAKIQAKEIEPEAKENLIAFKPKFKQPKDMQKDINAVEITEKNEVSATKQVRQMQPEFSLPGNTACDLLEIKEMTSANSMVESGDPPGMLPLKKMQKEWCCVVCQVTTTSEADLNSHFRGKQHEEACEKLNTKIQSSKSKIPPSVETGRPQNKEHSENVGDKQKAEGPKSHHEAPASVEGDAALENKEIGSTSIAGGDISDKQHMNDQKLWTCQLCQEICSNETDFTSHLLRKQHTDACEKLKANPNSKDSFESWTCGICHVKIRNEKHLMSHLQGRKHCDACEEYKMQRKTAKDEASSASFGNISKEKSEVVEVRYDKWRCSICNVSCSCEANMKDHLNGRKHLAKTRELNALAKLGERRAAKSRHNVGVVSDNHAGVTRWNKPAPGFIKCNFGASTFAGWNVIGYGCVASDCYGVFLGALHGLLPAQDDPLLAEALSCREALKWLRDRGHRQVYLESDCQLLINALNGSSVFPSYFGLLTNDCKALAQEFDYCQFAFVYRSANQVAHMLARAAGSFSGLEVGLLSPILPS